MNRGEGCYQRPIGRGWRGRGEGKKGKKEKIRLEAWENQRDNVTFDCDKRSVHCAPSCYIPQIPLTASTHTSPHPGTSTGSARIIPVFSTVARNQIRLEVKECSNEKKESALYPQIPHTLLDHTISPHSESDHRERTTGASSRSSLRMRVQSKGKK